MKKLVLFLLILTGTICGVQVSGQIQISAKISQMNYLSYEPIFVRVSITNRAGHALVFGSSDRLKGALRFDIQALDGTSKRSLPLKDPKLYPPLTGSIIAPGTTKEYTFNLADYYDMSKPGRYAIRATLTHSLFESRYLSAPVYITVVKGQTVWKTTVGLPTLVDEPDKPGGDKVKKRNYTILTYSTGVSMVYNLLIDDEKMVYANRRIAFNLGPELAPQCEIDFLSRLHVLLAASSKVFAYYVFTPDGRLDKRQILLRIDGIPKLSVDPKSGFVSAVGGREARPDQDYEEIRDLPFLGLKDGGAASLPVPPKGDSVRDLNAIPD